MNIGIDYTVALKQRGGIGRITRELIAAIVQQDTQNTYILLTSRDTPAFAAPAPHCLIRRSVLTERAMNIIWHRAHLPWSLHVFGGALDVFHAPNFTLPPVQAARRVVTIHDLTFLRYPAGAVPSLRRFLMASVPIAARRATHIVADSQATKDDLVEWLHLPAEKITVVYAGVDERFQPVTDETQRAAVRAKYHLSRPFILGLGTLEPRKNYVGLIRAFARAQLPDHELIIVGRHGWLVEPIIAAANATPGVRLLGFADDADLPALYSLASAYVLPSYYEGFGIPCIEAMACGTPVICSDSPCLPEIVNDAALSVAPDDTAALADALQRVVSDSALRETLIQRGFVRARAFPWARGARDLLSVYTN